MSPFLFIPAPFPVSSSALPTFSYLPTNSFSVFPSQLTAGLHVPASQTPSATICFLFSELLALVFFELCVSVKINLAWKINSLFFSSPPFFQL